MAIAHSLTLGEITPKKKPKYMTIPKLKAEFDFNTDTGHDLTDQNIKKGIEKLAPKVLAKHLKKRMEAIEKAVAGVDSDIDKEIKAFHKANGMSKKMKTMTQEQADAQNAFLNKLSDKIARLQAYLEQIVDGINKSDSLKWVDECYDVVFARLKKLIGNRQRSRATGGRARIVIMAVIAVAVTAVTIAATIVTGGAALAVIAVVAGASLSIIAAVGKGVVDLLNTRKKLRQSVEKLEKETEAAQILLDQCDKAVKNFKAADKKWLKDIGVSESQYQKTFGDKKPDAERLYPLLKGHKRTMVQFDKHYKDVAALTIKVHMGLRDLKAQQSDLEVKIAGTAHKIQEAIKSGEGDIKKLQALNAMAEKNRVLNEKVKRDINVAVQDFTKLEDMRKQASGIRKGFASYKIISKNIKGSTIKLSQVKTAFTTLDDVGKAMKSIGGDAGKIHKELNK